MDAFDLGAHLHQAFRHVADFRLARRVFDDGIALRQNRCHQSCMRRPNGDLGEIDVSALQAALGLGDDIARLDFDLGSELFHGHDVEIDGPRADGAAAGQRDLGFAAARQKGAEHPEAGPHFGHQVIGGRGVDNAFCGNAQGFSGHWALPRALARNRDVNPVILQDPLQAQSVHQARNIAQRQGFGGEQRRDHQGQGGVLGT